MYRIKVLVFTKNNTKNKKYDKNKITIYYFFLLKIQGKKLLQIYQLPLKKMLFWLH